MKQAIIGICVAAAVWVAYTRGKADGIRNAPEMVAEQQAYNQELERIFQEEMQRPTHDEEVCVMMMDVLEAHGLTPPN